MTELEIIWLVLLPVWITVVGVLYDVIPIVIRDDRMSELIQNIYVAVMIATTIVCAILIVRGAYESGVRLGPQH